MWISLGYPVWQQQPKNELLFFQGHHFRCYPVNKRGFIIINNPQLLLLLMLTCKPSFEHHWKGDGFPSHYDWVFAIPCGKRGYLSSPPSSSSPFSSSSVCFYEVTSASKSMGCTKPPIDVKVSCVVPTGTVLFGTLTVVKGKPFFYMEDVCMHNHIVTHDMTWQQKVELWTELLQTTNITPDTWIVGIPKWLLHTTEELGTWTAPSPLYKIYKLQFYSWQAKHRFSSVYPKPLVQQVPPVKPVKRSRSPSPPSSLPSLPSSSLPSSPSSCFSFSWCWAVQQQEWYDAYVLYNMDQQEVGWLHIPDVKTSHYMSRLCRAQPTLPYKVWCVWNATFQRWQPVVPAGSS